MPVKCRDCRWVQQIKPPAVYPDMPCKWRCGYFDRKRKVPFWTHGGFYVGPDDLRLCRAFSPRTIEKST